MSYAFFFPVRENVDNFKNKTLGTKKKTFKFRIIRTHVSY